MKRTKKLLSVLLALVLLLSFGTLAFAQEDPSNPSHEGRDCEWDKGRVVTAPTCTTPGEVKYTCKINGLHTKTEVIPATNHDYEWTITENSSATAPGTATAVCKNDPAHTKTFVIPAHGAAIEVGDCGAEGSDVQYTLYSDGTLVISGEGKTTGKMFGFNDPLQPTKLIVEEGITEIAEQAFMYQTTLTSIELPDSLRKIGRVAFWDCWNLKSISFGKNLETIDGDAFPECRRLESMILPDSVTSLGAQAFYGCNGLKTVRIPAGVASIGSKTFCECKSLEKLIILNGNAEMADDCLIDLNGATPTIYSFSGGSVEAYANQYGFKFVDLTPTQPDTPQEPDTPDTPDTPEQPQEKEKNAFEKIVDAIKRFFESIADFFRNLFN